MWLKNGLVAAITSSTVVLAATTPSQAAICCSKLSAAGLSSKVYLPTTAAYSERMDSYWSVSAALDPWCVVTPTSASDVSVVIKTLVANACNFGVRGGGHGAFAGSNSVDDGVTIDFGYMNGTTYNTETKIASVQPGGHWQSVYDTLAPYGVAVTGGRAGTVGVGGFISGGGNSFHSASHGMACDTVANFEVVLANGDIVNANEIDNPDLWQALKGSSGNLGLITRFDMYAIEFPDPANPAIWGGNLLYNLSAGPAVVDALVEFTDNVQKDENSSAIVYWAYIPAIGGMILNTAIENTLATVQPPAFDKFYAVDGRTGDTTKVDKMSVVTNELGAGQPPGFRNIWFTSSFKNDARIMNYAVEKFYDLNAELETLMTSDSGFNTLCMFQPITKSIVDKGINNGGNVIGLDSYIQSGNGIMFLVTFAVNGAQNEAVAHPKIQAYLDDVQSYARTLELAWDWRYLNYADKDQDPIASFGENAIAKIKAASEKYDPNGVFQTLRSSGFKI